jgi:flagellar assembly factor FliW
VLLSGTRFGDIDIDAAALVVLRRGLIGFPNETRFAVLRPTANERIGWLQSLQTPRLAFPVIELGRGTPRYLTESPAALALQAGLACEDISVFIIVSVRPQAPRIIANLLAPVVIERVSGCGAQIVLDSKRYSASTPLGATLRSLEGP